MGSRSVPPGLVKRSTGAQTADRALDVLACFKTAPGTLGLTQIARRLGLSNSVVHRLLQSLVTHDLLEQDLDTAQYRLGPGLAYLAEVFIRQRHFDLVESELRRLSTVAGGSAGIAARDGGDALVLAYSPFADTGELDARPRRVPLHLSAMGKVLLAFGDPDDGGGLEALVPLDAPTPHSIATLDRLRAELDDVAARGYGVASRETWPDQLSVAVPIFDRQGAIYLALGLRLAWSKAQRRAVNEALVQLRESAPRVTEIVAG
jgi:DNA-binding IclR family transcriptional regulator